MTKSEALAHVGQVAGILKSPEGSQRTPNSAVEGSSTRSWPSGHLKIPCSLKLTWAVLWSVRTPASDWISFNFWMSQRLTETKEVGWLNWLHSLSIDFILVDVSKLTFTLMLVKNLFGDRPLFVPLTRALDFAHFGLSLEGLVQFRFTFVAGIFGRYFVCLCPH